MDAAVQFLSESAEDSYSLASTFEFRYKLQDVALQAVPDPSKILTPAALAQARNAAAFAQTCGDELVTRIERGARLFVTIRATFMNQAARSDFSAHVNMGTAFNSFASDLSSVKKETRQKSEIIVSAFQLGGDPSHLATILKNGTAFPILQCSLDSLKPCQDALATIYTYATGTGRDSFRAEVSSTYDPSQPTAGLADLAYHTSLWSSLGIKASPSSLDVAKQATMNDLMSRFDHFVAAHRRLGDLRAPGKFPLCQADLVILDAEFVRTSQATATLANAIEYCFDHPLAVCTTRAQPALDRKVLPDVDSARLNPAPCYACGPQCDTCVDLAGTKTCLSCSRRVSDWLAGPLEVALKDAGGNLRTRADQGTIASLTCSNLPVGATVSVHASGTIGTSLSASINTGWSSWIQYYLSVNGISTAWSLPQTFFGAQSNAPSFVLPTVVPKDGVVFVAAVPTFCQHFVGQNDAHQIYECPVRFHPDFLLEVQARDLLIKMGYLNP